MSSKFLSHRSVSTAALLFASMGGTICLQTEVAMAKSPLKKIAQITGQPAIDQPRSSQSVDRPTDRSLPSLQSPQTTTAPTAAFSPTSSVSTANYVLGVGDQISLSVIGYPEFTGNLAVLPDGTVILPLIGPVQANGLTTAQLSNALAAQLRTYLVDPVTSVGLLVRRPVVVTVAGEVHRPGPIQLGRGSNLGGDILRADNTTVNGPELTEGDRQALPTLSSAVLLAGGVTRDADIRQVVVRRPVAGGGEELLTLDLWEVVTSGVGTADLPLRDGDSVFVPRLTGDDIDRRAVAGSSLAPSTITVKVVGEVVTPGEVAVPPNSSISSAVAIAGGPTNDAQLSNVSLVRQTDAGQIEEQEIDLSNLIDDYQVQDGDVVVVAKRGYLSVVDGVTRVLNPLNLFRLLGF